MASFEEGHFVNTRDQKLYYRKWKAPGVEPKAFMVFHHGYASHCGAYDNEFRRWTEAGIRVFLFDAHSFGRSEPLDPSLRSRIVSYEHLVDDVYTFRKEVVDKEQPSKPLPVFMAGLSMGGLTSILVALKDQSAWQGVVPISPAVDCPRNFQLKIMELLQGIMVRIIPNARLVPQPLIPNITLNPEERKKLENDEFFDEKRIRVCMGTMFLSAWNYIAKNEHTFALPLLIHYSSIDKIVYPPATERFAKNVASKDVTLKPFDKFAHDLYADTCKDESCTGIMEWILAHSNTAPAPVQS